MQVNRQSERRRVDQERREAATSLVSQGVLLPAATQVEIQQKSAVRCADKFCIKIDDCWRDPARRRCYDADITRCPAACPRAAYNLKLDLLPSAIRNVENGGEPLRFVTLIHPSWRREVGDLKSFDITAAKASLSRWLKPLAELNLIGFGAFEASKNVPLDKEGFWQMHYHGVFSGASTEQLQKALAIRDRSSMPKYARPLVIFDVDEVGRTIGYATKGGVDVRVAYQQWSGRQSQGKGSLLPHERDEYLRWRYSMRSDELLSATGMRRYRGEYAPLGQKSPKTARVPKST